MKKEKEIKRRLKEIDDILFNEYERLTKLYHKTQKYYFAELSEWIRDLRFKIGKIERLL